MVLAARFVAVSLAIASLILISPTISIGHEPMTEGPQRKGPFGTMLEQVALSADCYFTFEFDENTVPAELEVIEWPQTAADAKRLLAEKLPWAEVIQSRGGGQVLHIIDRATAPSRNPFDTKVSVNFAFAKGDVEGLVFQLNRSGALPAVLSTSYGHYHGAVQFAHLGQQRIKVSAENRPVRELLADVVPLSEYERVLWVARSAESEGRQVDVVIQ